MANEAFLHRGVPLMSLFIQWIFWIQLQSEFQIKSRATKLTIKVHLFIKVKWGVELKEH